MYITYHGSTHFNHILGMVYPNFFIQEYIVKYNATYRHFINLTTYILAARSGYLVDAIVAVEVVAVVFVVVVVVDV